MRIIGIILVLLGAAAVYCAAAVRRLLFGKPEEGATFDMKENIIKVIGTAIAMAGVLIIIYV